MPQGDSEQQPDGFATHVLSRLWLLASRLTGQVAWLSPERRLMATPPEARSPGQLARHLFELIFDRRDVDAARPFWTESSVNRFLALGVDARGPDQIATFFRELLAALPDLQMTIENVVEDDPPCGRPVVAGRDLRRRTVPGNRTGRRACRAPGV
jgi:SnoaL-like domain